MKARETRRLPGEGRNTIPYDRIIEVDALPEGAEEVDDSTPLHDWKEVK